MTTKKDKNTENAGLEIPALDIRQFDILLVGDSPLISHAWDDKAEQIVNLFNVAGFACGVGEWRPSKDGSFGTFHVESIGER